MYSVDNGIFLSTFHGTNVINFWGVLSMCFWERKKLSLNEEEIRKNVYSTKSLEKHKTDKYNKGSENP